MKRQLKPQKEVARYIHEVCGVDGCKVKGTLTLKFGEAFEEVSYSEQLKALKDQRKKFKAILQEHHLKGHPKE